jgi:hypothetical protein
VSLFSKLFGRKSPQGAVEAPTARHRAVPGMRGPDEGDSLAPVQERPMYREDQRHAGSGGGAGIAPGAVPSTSAGGFGADPYAQAQTGDPRQEAAGMTVCTRCGNSNPEASRFCSNCGAPLRARGQAEGLSEQTSTISISGLEAYDPEVTSTQATPVISPEAQAAVDALPPGSALLVVRRGPNSGSRFLLDTELTTAGRHPESDIFLDDITVSRRHVEFRRTPTGFSVADVGSLNGTYVNRERIDEVPLSTGDEVQIGKYRVVFFESRRGF